VLVVDAGSPRNALAGHVHNVLGRKRTPPAELVAIGRRDVEAYGGTVVDGHVSALSREDGGFRVDLAGRRPV
jgi:thioredoxin reductase (NADPH)